MTYSRQQWDRAVGLYIRYECCAADAIHELGYPSCLCSMVLRPVERLVFSPKER